MPKTKIFYLALLMVIANFVSAQSKTLIEINNPFINLSYPDKSIAIKALSTKNIEGNRFILEGPIVEIKGQGFTLDLKSAVALFDKTKNILELNREAKLLSGKEYNQIRIASDELVFDIEDMLLTSVKEVETNIDNIKIISLGMRVMQNSSGINAQFNKGNVSIKIKEKLSLGYAEKVKVIVDKKELILEGAAYLNHNDLIIESDLIHFSYANNEITKSLNAKIRNNS